MSLTFHQHISGQQIRSCKSRPFFGRVHCPVKQTGDDKQKLSTLKRAKNMMYPYTLQLKQVSDIMTDFPIMLLFIF